MSAERTNDIRAFKNFIDDQLTGGALPTVDELLARWDSENETTEVQDATVQALREALDDMDAGDTGIPVSEAVAALRPRASTVSVFSCPQAARISCPRGVRTGAAKPAFMTICENRRIASGVLVS